MFYVNREAELTVDLLSKIINSFIVDKQPKLKEYKNYYDGVQAILQKKYSDATKPCSRAVINYCRNIADSYCGYLASPGYISYSSDDDIEEIMNILRYNDYQTEDSNFLLDALVYGVASELMYLDATSQVRFRMISPVNSFAIYDDSLTGDLLYFVRMYAANPWDESNITYVDVYSDADIKHYSMEGENGQLTFISDEPHYFSQCPANVFSLPDEKSIFDCVIGLQDTANEVLNSEVDEFSAFADAYLTLTGLDVEQSDVQSMKENRVLVLPEGASASWLTKATNDTQVENILKRIQDSIYRIAACPDFSSESFVGGVSSGIAIQYRLTGMETRAAKIAAEMKKALQRRIEIITGIATLKLGEEVFRDINIDFKRNIPEDMTNVLNAINSLQGVVSDKTLLAQVPFVDDVQAEIEAVKEQKEANMSLYSFGLNNDGFGQEQLESDN
jgi:SPP1 family phage portal protein